MRITHFTTRKGEQRPVLCELLCLLHAYHFPKLHRTSMRSCWVRFSSLVAQKVVLPAS